MRDRADADHALLLPVVKELRAAGPSQRAIADHLNADGLLTRTDKP